MVSRLKVRGAATLAAVIVNLVSLSGARGDESAASPGWYRPPFTIAGADRVVLRRTAAEPLAAYALVVFPASGVDLRAWSPSVVAVVRDGSVETANDGAVTPELVAGDAREPARLKLAVQFARFPAPGTYEVTIALFPRTATATGTGAAQAGVSAPGRSDAGAAQLLRGGEAGTWMADGQVVPHVTVRLVLPAAQLRVSSPMHIDRSLPLWGDPDDAPEVLTIYETGKDAPASVTIRPDGELTSEGPPVAAWIALGPAAGSAAPAPIRAGGSWDVAIHLLRVPIGTSRGNLLITAPELASPITVPVEIRTHRTTWCIPLLFLAGALLGMAWRYASQQRRRQLEKQARVREVLERIAQLERGYPTAWQADLADLYGARDRLAALGDPPDDAMAATEQALAAAIATRGTRRAALLARLAEARDATLPSRFLPAGLELTAVARGFQAAYDHGVAGELARAIDLVSDASQQLAVLLTSAKTWARNVRDLLGPIKDGVPGCPTEARGPASAAIGRAIDSAGKIEAVSEADVVAADAPPVRPRLEVLQAARLDSDAVARVLVDGLAAAGEAIASTPGLDDGALRGIRSAVEVTAHPGRPERTIADAVSACVKLSGQVQAALARWHAGNLPPEVASLVSSGEYAAALAWHPADVGKAPGAPTSHGDALESLEIATAARAVALDVRRAPIEPAAAADGLSLWHYVPGAGGGPGAAQPPRTAAAIRRELAWWVRLGWVISALVAAVAAWAIYGGSFVGQRVELFGLLTTGFATDLATGGKLEELIGRIKMPGTG